MLTIVNIGTQEAYDIVDREKMMDYLISLKNNIDLTLEPVHPNNDWVYKNKETGEPFKYKGTADVLGTMPGAIAIHVNGEMDMRGVYCGLVVADILNLLDGGEKSKEFTRGMGDFIATCQTYEGGISCAPYGESHGGYTFCGLAAAMILKEEKTLNLDRLLDWLTQR